MYSFNYSKVLRKADENGWFQPRANELLQICVREDSNEPVIDRRSIDDKGIQDFVTQEPLGSTLGGLRLIICAPHKAANDAGRSFPFQRSTFETIMRAFHLPVSYLQSVSDGSPSLAKFGPGPSLEEKNITGYVLKTMWASGMNFALAISHDTRTGVTSGILDGCLEGEIEIVIDRISAACAHASHPLMVPTVLYELVTERNIQRTKASEGAMNDIELETGEHIYASRKQPDLQSIDSGGSMTARVNGTATTSMFTSANINSTIIGFQALLEHMDSPLPAYATARQTKMYEDGLALTQCIRYCLSISSNLQLETEQIRNRAKTQISAIYSLIAQRDSVLNLQVANGSNALADAARRDSSAMKTIAVLTILFLPGTFVAAFFAMPLFDWAAPDSKEIILPRFWIYWIVTIPCTFVVIGVWMTWIRINNRGITAQKIRPEEKDSKHKESAISSRKSNAFFASWRSCLAIRGSKSERSCWNFSIWDEEANVTERDQGDHGRLATSRKRPFFFQSSDRSKES